MMFFGKKDDGVRKELTKRIIELTLNTKYNLISLQYNSQHFGNVVVELMSDNIIVRFIYDRGDIYRDKRIKNSEHWINEELVYDHTMSRNEIYGLLFKAIDEFIMKEAQE